MLLARRKAWVPSGGHGSKKLFSVQFASVLVWNKLTVSERKRLVPEHHGAWKELGMDSAQWVEATQLHPVFSSGRHGTREQMESFVLFSFTSSRCAKQAQKQEDTEWVWPLRFGCKLAGLAKREKMAFSADKRCKKLDPLAPSLPHT